MRRAALALVPAVIVAAVVVWILAHGEDDQGGGGLGREPPVADASRDCPTHIEGRLPPADSHKDLTVGPVRFRGFRRTSRDALTGRPGDYFEIRHGEYHGLKFITEVRAGTDVTVAIAPPSRDRARLLYDLHFKYGRYGIPFDQGERAVRFRACAADHAAFSPRFYGRRTVGPWTQFNGGFLFARPQCLRLDVYVRGKEGRRFVEPFGGSRASCAGA